jgi:hypothetical protein
MLQFRLACRYLQFLLQYIQLLHLVDIVSIAFVFALAVAFHNHRRKPLRTQK